MAERKPRGRGRKPKLSDELLPPLDPARAAAVKQVREEYAAVGLSFEQALVNAIIGAENASKGLARVAENWKFDKLDLKPADSAEKVFDIMPSDLGRDNSAQESAAHSLAQVAKISVDDARDIVSATIRKPHDMIAAGKKLLKRKPRLSEDDLTDAEKNNPEVIRVNVEFARANTQTRIATLGEAEANKLRRARLIEKHDRDRRQKALKPAL